MRYKIKNIEGKKLTNGIHSRGSLALERKHALSVKLPRIQDFLMSYHFFLFLSPVFFFTYHFASRRVHIENHLQRKIARPATLCSRRRRNAAAHMSSVSATIQTIQ